MDQFHRSTEVENPVKAVDTSLRWDQSRKMVMYVSKKDTHMEASIPAANIPTNSLVDTKQNTKFSKFLSTCVAIVKT